MANARQVARETLGTLLTAGCTSAQAVHDYRIGDFGGKSPVVVLSSAGSARTRMTARGKRTTAYFQVDSFVVYASGAWTEQDAEDALDALDEQIAAVLAANQVTAAWSAIDEVDRSQRIDVEIGGVEYARESRVVRAEVFA